jgi:acyl-homoserine-lactone acylase
MRRPRRLSIIVALLAALPAAATAEAAGAGPGEVKIRRTAFGIPHIQARSLEGAGFGYGYAFAQDNICTMAETYVTVDGQRSRYFGPDATYVQRGNGAEVKNLDSDLFWQEIIDSGRLTRLLAQRPPLGPEPDVRAAVRGYVAGYNAWLRHAGGADGVGDPRCRGKAWVRPISLATAYRRIYQLVLLASSGVALEGIASAQPPATTAPPANAAAARVDAAALTRHLAAERPPDGGSNAVAVGRAGTRDRRHGLLLGNPHFPWIGPERFYQAQITVPGRIDVAGASLYGVPAILIGHTRDFAWSHTVSTAYRFTPFELKLAPGDPTSYLVDGKAVPMTKRTVTVQARRADGRLAPVSRTLYSTRWGPVFTALQGFSLPWTTTTAYALGDANRDNLRALNHFFAMDRVRSVPQALRVLRRYEGLPWVNTIAADRAGRALYADIGTVPHVTNEHAARCNTPLGRFAFTSLGLPILDGSRSACAWGTDRDAAVPGILGAGRLPHLVRSDYVTNSNDSYWLSNPAAPLEGYPRIVGDERTPRSLRTRIGLIMTRRQIAAGGFTRPAMQRMVFSNRQYAGELTRDALVGVCRSLPGGLAPTSSGAPVAVGGACDVLARWDLHEDLGSRGAILFRLFFGHAAGASDLWATPFSVVDPVNTPNTLNTASAGVRTALGDAIADLRAAGLPLDARVGDVQGVTRGGRLIGIHGGPGDPHGQFNAIGAPFHPDARGFEDIVHGSSYVQVVTWNRGRCPDVATILTYSQSENPRSPHNADQTRLFSRKRWVRGRFCRRDVLDGTVRTTTLRPRTR